MLSQCTPAPCGAVAQAHTRQQANLGCVHGTHAPPSPGLQHQRASDRPARSDHNPSTELTRSLRPTQLFRTAPVRWARKAASACTTNAVSNNQGRYDVIDSERTSGVEIQRPMWVAGPRSHDTDCVRILLPEITLTEQTRGIAAQMQHLRVLRQCHRRASQSARWRR